MGAAKVAVSVPAQLFEAMEAERHRTGETRSELVQQAVELLLKRRSTEEDDRRYAEAYRKYPETDEQVAVIGAAGLEVLRVFPYED
jgi:metal-responsive CopG/Arc/MetJ family transcriptional regulator